MPQPNQYGQYPGFAGGYGGFPGASAGAGGAGATSSVAGAPGAATGGTPTGVGRAGSLPGQGQAGADGQGGQAQWGADPNAFYSQSYWGGSSILIILGFFESIKHPFRLLRSAGWSARDRSPRCLSQPARFDGDAMFSGGLKSGLFCLFLSGILLQHISSFISQSTIPLFSCSKTGVLRFSAYETVFLHLGLPLLSPPLLFSLYLPSSLTSGSQHRSVSYINRLSAALPHLFCYISYRHA